MMKSLLNIFPLILNEKSFKYEVLSLSEDTISLPYIELSSYQNIEDSLVHLLGLHIGENAAKSVNYKLSDILVLDQVHIFYIVFVPFRPELKNSFTLPISTYETNLPNIQKIIKSLI